MVDLNSLWHSYSRFSADPAIWLPQLIAIGMLTLIGNAILMRTIDWGERIAARTQSDWDDALLEAARTPLKLLVWMMALSLGWKILETAVPDMPTPWHASDLRRWGFILILWLFGVRFIQQIEHRLLQPERDIDVTTVRSMAKLLRLSVSIAAGLILMETIGFSVSGVLAFGGIGGVAVGFASKDLLANFFGGLMIYLDKPFSVGDWVRSPDRQIEGTVEDIGWRLTRIRTFDKRPLYIPNSMFASIVVENPSRMTHRRIYENLGIRYEDGHRMASICSDIRTMLREHPDIDPSQTQIVHFNGYGASHLEFMVYAFTRTTEWVRYHAVKEEILLRIMQIVESHGAEFAFPTRTLHLASAPGASDPADVGQAVPTAPVARAAPTA